MRGFALGLQLPEGWFAQHGTAEPLVLLRLFNYPSRCVPADSTAQWGVDEHTDYGLLTLLWQDDVGGLQVRTDDGWIDVRSIPGSFVCNVGDMLDFMTGGGYRFVPHRVRPNTSGRDRLSIPFFFDPDFGSRLDAGQGHREMRARQPRHAGGPQGRGHPRRGGCAHEVGVVPSLIPDFLALVGDAADGYPGIAGIGQVTAAQLLNRHGAIEAFPAPPYCHCEMLVDRTYFLPLGDHSWPDDTRVEFEYMDDRP